jgi:hypothetical protein
MKKKIQIKRFFDQKLQIFSSYLQEKPSALKRQHLALQKRNFINFFSMLVGHFCPPGSGYGSMDPIDSGSNPDPQDWIVLRCTR